VGEHGGAFGRQGFAEHDAVDELRKLVAPLFQGALAEIILIIIEAEKVEGDE
jgi:hypothetical protein